MPQENLLNEFAIKIYNKEIFNKDKQNKGI